MRPAPARFPKRYHFKDYLAYIDKTQAITDLIRQSENHLFFLEKVKNISKRTKTKIEWKTRGQSKNRLWFKHRKSIITGSVVYTLNNAFKKKTFNIKTFGKIAKRFARRPLPEMKWGTRMKIKRERSL